MSLWSFLHVYAGVYVDIYACEYITPQEIFFIPADSFSLEFEWLQIS